MYSSEQSIRGENMYVLGIVYLILIIIITRFILKNSKRVFIMKLFCILLLIYKTVEYTIYGLNLELSKIPIEYSTISYFIFSIAILFNIKKLYGVASFIAFISGFGYLLAFSVVGHIFIREQGLIITMIALINHTILFYGSMIMISHHKLNLNEFKSILKFTTIYLIYVIVLNVFFDFSKENIFIQMLLGINFVGIDEKLISYAYLFYFLVLVIVYIGVIKLFFFINRYLFMKGYGNYEHTI